MCRKCLRIASALAAIVVERAGREPRHRGEPLRVAGVGEDHVVFRHVRGE